MLNYWRRRSESTSSQRTDASESSSSGNTAQDLAQNPARPTTTPAEEDNRGIAGPEADAFTDAVAQQAAQAEEAPVARNNVRLTWSDIHRIGKVNAEGSGPDSSELFEANEWRPRPSIADPILGSRMQFSEARETIQSRPMSQSGDPTDRDSIYRRGSHISTLSRRGSMSSTGRSRQSSIPGTGRSRQSSVSGTGRSRQSSLSGTQDAAPTPVTSRRSSRVIGLVQGVMGYVFPVLAPVSEDPPDEPSTPETPLIMALDGPVYSPSSQHHALLTDTGLRKMNI